MRDAAALDPLLQSDMRALTPSPRRHRVALVGAALLLLALDADDPVPWPSGDPHQGELTTQIERALEHHDRRRRREYLEAWQPGEAALGFSVRQEDIDAGQWELDDLLGFGAALFEHEFRTSDGHGALGMPGPLQRVHKGRRGGLDGFSCAGCHSQGGDRRRIRPICTCSSCRCPARHDCGCPGEHATPPIGAGPGRAGRSLRRIGRLLGARGRAPVRPAAGHHRPRAPAR